MDITQRLVSFSFSSNPGHPSSLMFCAAPTIRDYWEYIMVEDLAQVGGRTSATSPSISHSQPHRFVICTANIYTVHSRYMPSIRAEPDEPFQWEVRYTWTLPGPSTASRKNDDSSPAQYPNLFLLPSTPAFHSLFVWAHCTFTLPRPPRSRLVVSRRYPSGGYHEPSSVT
ncbi:uncharacterized protein ARMOST_02718 [Armillaria ostoyae]|uniref:Uncharacterized protein n=1 Tax=Armillaria ostoyae TaxID=47428 RepID=A0A284QSI4_ARMOS|nr:uncharacterized protein ARMOST_02718 [Armillaria ostoyae]